MFTKESIIAELQSGKSIEQIAQAAADALNAAKAEYDTIKLREQEEKRKAAMLQQEKEKKANAITTSLFDYLSSFHSDIFSPADQALFNKHMNAKAIVDAIDSTMAEIEKVAPIAEALKKAKCGKTVQVELNDEDAAKVESAISKFLKENNLF